MRLSESERKMLAKKIQLQHGCVIGTLAELEPTRFISTGIPSLDIALGTGGWPRGSTIELFGGEGSGKSTIVLHSLARASREDDISAFLLYNEGKFDDRYARKIGIDPNNIMINKTLGVSKKSKSDGSVSIERSSQEGYLGMILQYLEEDIFNFIVIDSIVAMPTQSELDTPMDRNEKVATKSMGFTRFLNKAVPLVTERNAVLILINQLRDNMKTGYSPTDTPMGRALKHACLMRISVSRGDSYTTRNIIEDDDDDKNSGRYTKIKVVKNKFGPEGGTANLINLKNHGIRADVDILNLSSEKKIISKLAGNTYTEIDTFAPAFKLYATEQNMNKTTFEKNYPTLGKGWTETLANIRKTLGELEFWPVLAEPCGITNKSIIDDKGFVRTDVPLFRILYNLVVDSKVIMNKDRVLQNAGIMLEKEVINNNEQQEISGDVRTEESSETGCESNE